MINRRSAVYAVSFAALTNAMPGTARASCSEAELAQKLPVSAKAIADWERQRKTVVAGSAKTELQTAICNANSVVAEQTGNDQQDVDERSRRAIFAYLDDNRSMLKMAPSLQSRLEKTVSYGAGPALPEPIRMVMLQISFTKPVDELFIGSTKLSLTGSYLLSGGVLGAAITGKKGGVVVCSGPIPQLGVPLKFTC